MLLNCVRLATTKQSYFTGNRGIVDALIFHSQHEHKSPPIEMRQTQQSTVCIGTSLTLLVRDESVGDKLERENGLQRLIRFDLKQCWDMYTFKRTGRGIKHLLVRLHIYALRLNFHQSIRSHYHSQRNNIGHIPIQPIARCKIK